MKGSIRIELEYKNGLCKEVIDERNYVLARSRAYLLNHIIDGRVPVDPIASFMLGRGGAPLGNNKAPLASLNTDINGAMYDPLVCANEDDMIDPLYDRDRLVATSDGTPADLASINSESTKKTIYSFYVDFDEANGLDINETGLITQSGRLFNHKTFPTITKTSAFKINFTWTLEYL